MLRDAERKAAISFFGADSTADICPLSMLRKLDDMKSSRTNKARLDHSPHFFEKADHLLKCYQEQNSSSVNLDAWSSDGHINLYDVDAYDPTAKSQDPWTNNILRASSKPRIIPPPITPPRSVKHAEFYNCKERLQTELEFTIPGRKDHIDESESIMEKKNGYQSHKESSERCLSVVPSDDKLGDGPRIPPRGKRFTPSSILSSIGSMKKTSVEHDKSQCLTEISKHSESSWMKNDYVDNNYSTEKIDHAFFLIMKNFIEEAVSESFARYKLNELKNNLSKYSSTGGTLAALPFTTSTTTTNNRTHHPFMVGKSQSTTHIEITTPNGHLKNNNTSHSNNITNSNNNNNNVNETKNHTIQEDSNLEHSRKPHEKKVEISEFIQEANHVDSSKRDYYCPPPTIRTDSKLMQDENIRNKELECENSRLTAEVERLKTRLRLYEELASAMNSNMAAFHPVIPLSLTNSHESAGENVGFNMTSGSTMKRTMSLMSSNPNLTTNQTTSSSITVPSGLKSENDLTRHEQFSYNNVPKS
ncbi:unnamed protein product [Schistosoma turkestanicum]|nr:unnamed protein product [Schistosoma turkestanicum]